MVLTLGGFMLNENIQFFYAVKLNNCAKKSGVVIEKSEFFILNLC